MVLNLLTVRFLKLTTSTILTNSWRLLQTGFCIFSRIALRQLPINKWGYLDNGKCGIIGIN